MTQHDLRSAIGELLPNCETVALCFDFDGTLAPIVQNPDDATLPAATRCHLVALADYSTVDVAVVSGRALDDIRARVGVSGVAYAGNHGFELSRDGNVWVHPAIERHRPALDRAREQLEQELAPVAGCFVEDKYATLTVHHRQAGPDAGSTAITAVQTLVDDEDSLSMVVDEQSVEVRPAVDHDKGDAVEKLFDADPETLVMYFGDAQTDVDAFRTLAAWDDETVHVSVGGPLPASGYRLDSPADVERFLCWLRAELRDAEA